jgi:hypothetical protein
MLEWRGRLGELALQVVERHENGFWRTFGDRMVGVAPSARTSCDDRTACDLEAALGRLRGAHDRGRGAVCRVGLLRVWSSVIDVVAMFRPRVGKSARRRGVATL